MRFLFTSRPRPQQRPEQRRQRRLGCASAAALLASLFLSTSALADYPERQVRMVVSVQPGASTDIMARTLAQKLAERLGQSVIVDNKPGAATRIGTEAVIKTSPDGYTLGVANAVSTAFPLMFDDFPFVVGKHFAPITLLGRSPSFLAVRHNLPAKNVAEFVAYAKTHNDLITFGHGGAGTNPHVAALALMQSLGVTAIAVPHKGNAPTAVALGSGEIDFALLEYASVRPMVERGKVRLLAVTEPQRFSPLPEIPTGAEAGLTREIEGMTPWFMLIAPAGTPQAVVTLLNRHVAEILSTPDVQQRFRAMGIEPATNSPAEAASYFQAQRDKLGALTQKLNLSLKN